MSPHGMDVRNRALIVPDLPRLTRLSLPDPVTGPLRINAGHITKSAAYCSLSEEVTFDNSLIDAKITPRVRLGLNGCLVAALLDGTSFSLSRCRVGTLTRPDGSMYRPTEDGIRPCPAPGSPQMSIAGTIPSLIVESDIVSESARTSAHQDGIQLWCGGNLAVVRSKVTGWWNGAVFAKTDHGPIDRITLEASYFGGADWFQIRLMDGGHGRPTNVTIRDVAVQTGKKGGRHPINTGDDLCSDASQTRYVRTETDRLDPTWVVYSGVTDHLGEHLPPVTGWYDPRADSYSYVF